MVIHKYLFFVEEDQVMVYILNGKEFDCETNQGEKRFPVSNDFWDWWIEAASFNKENDCVDFCFISDRNYDFINHNFYKAEESIWKNSIIEKFFMTKIEYSQIRLKNEEQTITKSYHKGNTPFSDNSIRIFYTNIYLENKSRNKLNVDKNTDENDEEISDLARYFINKTKQENS